jgi:hypothetical protein
MKYVHSMHKSFQDLFIVHQHSHLSRLRLALSREEMDLQSSQREVFHVQRVSAKHGVKDDFAFLREHAIFVVFVSAINFSEHSPFSK